MTDAPDDDLTRVLTAAAEGDEKAAAELLPLVYTQLRRVARARMVKVPPGQTLQPTALVHEAYLRLAGRRDGAWSGREHFFCAAARAMRDILVENARRKASLKRGGGRRRIHLDEAGIAIQPPSEDVVAVDEAVRKLEVSDPDSAQVVYLKYFCGLTTNEIAEVLGISVATVERRWKYVRAVLFRELSRGSDDDSAS